MKPGKTGIVRIFDAAGYSMKGIKYSWKNESAFRQELILASIMLPAAFFIGQTSVEIALMLFSIFVVIIVELLNTGLEAIVDKTSPEMNPLAGAAKDCGSAAVFFALLNVVVIWGLIIASHFI